MYEKRVLITGTSGLLGGNLLNLLPVEWELVGIVHTNNLKPLDKRVSFLKLDFLHSDFLNSIEKSGPYDAIIHCAAFTNVDRCEVERETAYLLNVESTARLATYAGLNNIHFIHISTDHIFDGKKGGYTETDIPNPVNYYAETKLNAEKKVESLAREYTIIRTNFFGFNIQPKHDIAGWMLDSLRAREVRNLFTDVYFSPLLVNRVVEILKEIIEQRVLGLFHITAPDSCSKYEFGLKLGQVFGLDTSVFHPCLIEDVKSLISRPKNMSLNTKKAQKILKTKLPKIDESILEYKELYMSKYPYELRRMG